MGIYKNISCSRVRFDLLNSSPSYINRTYYADISNETCPNELYQDITAPDINYEGKVKVTYECNTEFEDPCQILSMLQRTSTLSQPTSSTLSKSSFSISQLCNTTAPSSISIFETAGGATGVNVPTSATALETGSMTAAVSMYSTVPGAVEAISTSSSFAIDNPGDTLTVSSSLITASDSPTSTVNESIRSSTELKATQSPTIGIMTVTTGSIGIDGICTCVPLG
ncbi:hypothetical protein GGI42DRAFT_337816 [Trichoderma sp. SZMC 28013]